jgi:hypothetical protein
VRGAAAGVTEWAIVPRPFLPLGDLSNPRHRLARR